VVVVVVVVVVVGGGGVVVIVVVIVVVVVVNVVSTLGTSTRHTRSWLSLVRGLARAGRLVERT
jgi:hypothetical protein